MPFQYILGPLRGRIEHTTFLAPLCPGWVTHPPIPGAFPSTCIAAPWRQNHFAAMISPPRRPRACLPQCSSTDPSPQPKSQTINYNEALSNLRRANGSLAEAAPIIAQMRETCTPADSFTYTNLILLCLRPRADAVNAQVFLDSAVSAFPPPLPATVLAAFLAVCARANDCQRAEAAWVSALEGGANVTVRAVGAFVDCLSRAGKADEARLVLRDFPVGDTLVSRTSIVSGLARIPGRADDALDALREMQELGFSPNVRAYTAVTHAFGRERRAQAAVDLLEEALSDNVQVDALLFESVILSCGACGEVDLAFSVLQAMKAHSLPLSDRAYEGLIFSCGSAGKTSRATVVYQGAVAANSNTPRVASAYASALLRKGVSDERAVELLIVMQTYVARLSDARLKRKGVSPRRFHKKIADLERIVSRARLKSGRPGFRSCSQNESRFARDQGIPRSRPKSDPSRDVKGDPYGSR